MMVATKRPEPVVEEVFDQPPQSACMSRLEYNLITLMFGFSRWVESCMAAGNVHGLGALDILVMHSVNHRARGRRLSDIGMVLNIDDTYLIAYSLKKLLAAGLISAERQGRERRYTTTEDGDRACLEYRRAREAFLIDPFFNDATQSPEMDGVSAYLSRMTAIYDQACRGATVSTLDKPKLPPVRTKR